MLNKKHNQSVKIPIKCEFFTNQQIERIEKKLNNLSTMHKSHLVFSNELRKEREITLLQHEGKVTHVFCHLLKDGKCGSPKNNGNKCHILSQL